MKQRLALVLSLAYVGLALAGPAAAASAPPVHSREHAAALWTLTDGCVETVINVYSAQERTPTGDVLAPTTAFIDISQHESCTNPLSPLPVRNLTGSTQTGVTLEVRGDLRAGRLTASLPVSCGEYVPGSCAVAPFDARTVTLSLTFASDGELVRYPWGDYRYGRATGSIQLGDTNLLALGGGGMARSDPTETNLGWTFLE